MPKVLMCSHQARSAGSTSRLRSATWKRLVKRWRPWPNGEPLPELTTHFKVIVCDKLHHLMRKALLAFVMLFTWTVWAEAQQRGEQTPPPQPPQPTPQPRMPSPVPDRPQPGTAQRINISGR